MYQGDTPPGVSGVSGTHNWETRAEKQISVDPPWPLPGLEHQCCHVLDVMACLSFSLLPPHHPGAQVRISGNTCTRVKIVHIWKKGNSEVLLETQKNFEIPSSWQEMLTFQLLTQLNAKEGSRGSCALTPARFLVSLVLQLALNPSWKVLHRSFSCCTSFTQRWTRPWPTWHLAS